MTPYTRVDQITCASKCSLVSTRVGPLSESAEPPMKKNYGQTYILGHAASVYMRVAQNTEGTEKQ